MPGRSGSAPHGTPHSDREWAAG